MSENTLNGTQVRILDVCEQLKKLLLHKNKKYGNSAIEPIRIFVPEGAKLYNIESRLDEKLSRVIEEVSNTTHPKPGDVVDIAGYCVLWLVKNDVLDFKEWMD